MVDIVDSHGIFQNQWKKRRAFYKKENYKIIHTTNQKYREKIWNTVYDPIAPTKQHAMTKKEADDECLQGKCLLKLKKATITTTI